jgi:hypothetical protein
LQIEEALEHRDRPRPDLRVAACERHRTAAPDMKRREGARTAVPGQLGARKTLSKATYRGARIARCAVYVGFASPIDEWDENPKPEGARECAERLHRQVRRAQSAGGQSRVTNARQPGASPFRISRGESAMIVRTHNADASRYFASAESPNSRMVARGAEAQSHTGMSSPRGGRSPPPGTTRTRSRWGRRCR